jgi:hypothetical protein
MLYWWFHFKKWISINCLFTLWKWTYVLDLDLADEVHSIRVIWTNNLQECEGDFIFQGQAEWAWSMDFGQGVREVGPNLGQMCSSPWAWWASKLHENRCWRLKPSYEFQFGGLSNFSPSIELKDWFKSKTSIQEHKLKYKTHSKLVHELCGTCF